MNRVMVEISNKLRGFHSNQWIVELNYCQKKYDRNGAYLYFKALLGCQRGNLF